MTISRYRLVEKFGQGGTRVVYRAEDSHLEPAAALKFLGAHVFGNGLAKERLLREATTAAGIGHQNRKQLWED